MTYVIVARWRPREGQTEKVEAILHELAPAARKEPGNRQFDIDVDPREPTRVMLYEVYVDQEAFEAHQQTPHFKEYLAEAVPLLAFRERHVWKRIE